MVFIQLLGQFLPKFTCHQELFSHSYTDRLGYRDAVLALGQTKKGRAISGAPFKIYYYIFLFQQFFELLINHLFWQGNVTILHHNLLPTLRENHLDKLPL